MAKASKPRDLTNTGTCGWCFRNVKLRNGRVVLHGYKRPGWGEAIGRCPGTNREPYERSTKVTEVRLAELQKVKESLTTRIEQVSSDEFRGKVIDQYRRKHTVYEYGSPEWALIRREMLGRLKSDLHYHDRDIEFLTKKIEEWHPGMTMPDGAAA